MAETNWESAFESQPPADLAIDVSDGGPHTMIDVRLAEADKKGRNAAAKALGFALPTNPRTSTSAGDVSALWLSIDQWLVVAPHKDRAKLVDGLNTALEGQFSAITDLSDARSIIKLRGDGARETIMKGGAADLLADDFGVGSVRRMNFADIAAMVHYRNDDPDELDVFVFRSYADYASRWLAWSARPGANLRLFGKAEAPDV